MWPAVSIIPATAAHGCPPHNETLSSYLARLARANRLDTDALRTHLTGTKRKNVPIPVDDLALLSGQHTRTLRYALLELGADQGLPGTISGTRPPPHGDSQLRCTHCTLTRGHHGTVWCWTHQEDVVCRRHHRWIGDMHQQAGHHQPSLRDQPDILQANRLHRRIIRSHSRVTATVAFGQATRICLEWHRRLEHDDDFYRLMNRFHSGQWRTTATDPTVHAARYSQIIALTRLLASPTWQSRCFTNWPEPLESSTRSAAPSPRTSGGPFNGTTAPSTHSSRTSTTNDSPPTKTRQKPEPRRRVGPPI